MKGLQNYTNDDGYIFSQKKLSAQLKKKKKSLLLPISFNLEYLPMLHLYY